MRSKPKGPKYRYLTARDGVIYYQRVFDKGKRRIRESLETSSWEEAAQRREKWYEGSLGIKGGDRSPRCELPTFADFAQRYLDEDTRHLARTTLSDRQRELRPGGPLLSRLGDYGLDQLTTAVLRQWWTDTIDTPGRQIKTGRNLLDTISGVLGYALELELIEANPVHGVRERVRRKARSKQGRAEAEQKAHPIEEPENIAAILESTRVDGIKSYANVLLQLDAGLRVSDAGGLRWRSIEWGEGNAYKGRALNIVEAKPRGGPSEPPKSGRSRRVDLSLRLRDALEELMDEEKVPGPDTFVLAGLNQDNFRKYAWQNIVERAGVGHRTPKDLRDTFASQLLTVGIQLGYISNALGHADVSITARHYAKYIPRDGYRKLEPRAGELPPDLLARLA